MAKEKIHNFRELKVWKEAIKLSKNIFAVTKLFPDYERYSLVSQLTRSSISIASNISEGSSRSNKEFKKFLNISLGSCFELETQLIISHEVGYISNDKLMPLIQQVTIIQRMIVNFKKTLND